jgi:hypothetical protein
METILLILIMNGNHSINTFNDEKPLISNNFDISEDDMSSLQAIQTKGLESNGKLLDNIDEANLTPNPSNINLVNNNI